MAFSVQHSVASTSSGATRRRPDAEDAVQETYLRFVRTDPAELRDVLA